MVDILSRQSSTSFRAALKAALFNSRYLGTNSPKCPICRKPVTTTSAEMHEVFLTRGDVQNAPAAVREGIHARANCVLVHPGECHLAAQHTQTGKQACARHLIRFEGYITIRAWLIGLAEQMRGDQAAQALRFLNDVMSTYSD